jgi:hypothetical protein
MNADYFCGYFALVAYFVLPGILACAALIEALLTADDRKGE